MLYSVYSEKVNDLALLNNNLSVVKKALLNHLKSRQWYDRVTEVLPSNWDDQTNLVLYSNPNDVYLAFKEETRHRGYTPVFEKEIVLVLGSEKQNASKGKYVEYTKRDDDFPFDANKWTSNTDMCEFEKPSFHVDHRLVWISAERSIDFLSTQDINEIPYKYTVHVYNPEATVLTNVHSMELNKV